MQKNLLLKNLLKMRGTQIVKKDDGCSVSLIFVQVLESNTGATSNVFKKSVKNLEKRCFPTLHRAQVVAQGGLGSGPRFWAVLGTPIRIRIRASEALQPILLILSLLKSCCFPLDITKSQFQYHMLFDMSWVPFDLDKELLV